MNETRWFGLAAVIVGGVICAWQAYEVQGGEHFTLWMIGCIPLPVIALGILFILGGLIALIGGRN